MELLLKQAVRFGSRRVVPAALEMESKTGAPAALELPSGQLVYGKTSDLPGAFLLATSTR